MQNRGSIKDEVECESNYLVLIIKIVSSKKKVAYKRYWRFSLKLQRNHGKVN